MKFHAKLQTGGDGLWSTAKKIVEVTHFELGYYNEEDQFGELRAFFTKSSWNVNDVGFIYTDELWLAGLRLALMSEGYSSAAAKDVDYSEQGMQDDNYVSLDVCGKFLTEWFNKGGTA